MSTGSSESFAWVRQLSRKTDHCLETVAMKGKSLRAAFPSGSASMWKPNNSRASEIARRPTGPAFEGA